MSIFICSSPCQLRNIRISIVSSIYKTDLGCYIYTSTIYTKPLSVQACTADGALLLLLYAAKAGHLSGRKLGRCKM
jgi:hypothetical protein